MDTHKLYNQFHLVSKLFGVKYSGKGHDLHLKTVLEDGRQVQSNHRLGSKIEHWYSTNMEYEKFTVQLSTPGYLYAAIH